MIDLHAHVLSDIDDGSTSFIESVAMLAEAKKAGFTGIVCTPHFMQGFYEKNIQDVEKKIEELSIDSKRIGVHLYQGNEVYVATEICDFIREGKVSTINGGKYLLMEFPINGKPLMNSMEIIDDIVKNGYVPIVAHPERYEYVQKDIKFAEELLKRGALLQANYASIDGHYGSGAKKTLIKMLKKDMIQFFGSDAHRKKSVYRNMDKYVIQISKYISEDKFDELTYKNPIKTINGGDINI